MPYLGIVNNKIGKKNVDQYRNRSPSRQVFIF